MVALQQGHKEFTNLIFPPHLLPPGGRDPKTPDPESHTNAGRGRWGLTPCNAMNMQISPKDGPQALNYADYIVITSSAIKDFSKTHACF